MFGKKHIWVTVLCLFLIISGCTGEASPTPILPEPVEATTKPTSTGFITEADAKILTSSFENRNMPTPAPSPTPIPTLPVINMPPEGVYTPEEVYPAHAFLYHTQEGIRMMLYDGWGKTIREIPFESDSFVIGMDAFQPPCKIALVGKTEEGILLFWYDLSTGETEDIFRGQKQPDDSWQTWPKISPGRQWVAYVVWSSEMYYNSAEFQDVELVRIPVGRPLRVTSGGGSASSGGVWSPVEDILAFSDTDERGNQQLYIYNPNDAKREKLTDFSDPLMKISSPSWAKQGDRIAFVVNRDYWLENQKAELWVTDLQEKQTGRIALPDAVNQIASEVYWREDGDQIMVFTADPDGNTGFYWVNLQENIIQYSFDGDQANRLYFMEMPFAFTKDSRAVGSFSSGIVYDAVSNTILRLKDIQVPESGLPIDLLTIQHDIRGCFSD